MEKSKKHLTAPVVSIIVPVYNGEMYIKECLDSILSQTYNQFEVLVVDDASTDRSIQIIQQFAESDARIKLHLFNRNIGLGGNWNRGLTKARGRYIKMVCQDDQILPEYLENAVTILEEFSNVSLVCSFEKPLNKNKIVIKERSLPYLGMIQAEEAQKSLLKDGNWIGAPTGVLFRTETLSKAGFFDPSLPCGLDVEMWLRLLKHGNTYVLPKVLYSCRTHSGQETNRCRKNLGFKKDYISIIQKILDSPALYSVDLSAGQLRYMQRREMQRLLTASKDSKNVHVKDSVLYILRFQSVFQTAFIIIKTALIYLYTPVSQLLSNNRK